MTTYAPPRPRTMPRRTAPPRSRPRPRPKPRPRPAMEPRLRDRRVAVIREAGRRRLRRLLWVLGAAAVAAAATGAVLSPILDVNQIAVVGVDGAHAAEVRAAAGVEHGAPLMLVDTGAATERIEKLPWVDEARVSRRLPGTLRVEITPRFPVAWRPGDPGEVELIDRRGVAVTTAPAPPAGLPQLQAEGPDVPIAARIASALGNALAPQVATVVVAGGHGKLLLVTGPEVRLGEASDLEGKVRAAAAVLAALNGLNVNYLDVRVPSAPATG